MIEQYAPLLSLFLIQGRRHPLSSPFPFFYISSWLSNKTPQEIINDPISFLLSYVRHLFKITALFTFLL